MACKLFLRWWLINCLPQGWSVCWWAGLLSTTTANGLDTEADLHPLALRFADEEVFRRVCEKIEEIRT